MDQSVEHRTNPRGRMDRNQLFLQTLADLRMRVATGRRDVQRRWQALLCWRRAMPGQGQALSVERRDVTG